MGYHSGMGAVAAGTYPSGSRFAAGYYVTGLIGTPANAVDQLRQAMQAGFLGRTIEVGWGPKHGVPSGNLFALIETARAGITGAEINTIFSRVGAALQGRGVGTVRNTYAHAVGGGGGSSVPAPSPGNMTSLLTPVPSSQVPFPGSMPTTDPNSMYYAPPEDAGFMSQSIGGIPVWGLMVGGVAVVGILGYSLMASARKRPVQANRRGSRRRSR